MVQLHEKGVSGNVVTDLAGSWCKADGAARALNPFPYPPLPYLGAIIVRNTLRHIA